MMGIPGSLGLKRPERSGWFTQHRFPSRRSERLQSWAKLLPAPGWCPCQTSWACDGRGAPGAGPAFTSVTAAPGNQLWAHHPRDKKGPQDAKGQVMVSARRQAHEAKCSTTLSARLLREAGPGEQSSGCGAGAGAAEHRVPVWDADRVLGLDRVMGAQRDECA